MLKTRAGHPFTPPLASCCCALLLATLLEGLGTVNIAGEGGGQEKPLLVLDAGGHTADIQSLAFTPDGRTLISSSSDRTVRFWDTATGVMERIFRLPIYGDNAQGGKAALSPDGQLLAVAMRCPDGGNGIVLIALPQGRILRLLKGHTDNIWCLAFSPNGKLLASASKDATARLWDVASGKCEHILAEHRGAVTGLAFSPDGGQLATASYDATARIWSVATGQSRIVLESAYVRLYSMSGIAWSPDGRTVVTGHLGAPMRVWNLNGTIRESFRSSGSPRSLQFASDSRRLLYAGDYGGYLFDLDQGQDRAVCAVFKDKWAWSAALSRDGRIAATGGRGGEDLCLWNTADGRPLHQLAGRGQSPWGVGWSPDGKSVAWGNTGLRVPDSDPSGLTAAHPLEWSFSPSELEFASPPDRSFRGCLPNLGSLRLERTVTFGRATVKDGGESLCELEPQWTLSASFVPGDRVVVAGFQGMGLYEARTGRLLREFSGHSSAVRSLAPSPDNQYLLSSASDQTLRIWRFDRGEPLLSLFFAGDEWIAWTPEGYYAASAGGEQLMGWQVNNGPEQMASFYPASQFRKSLYRPDLVRLLLRAGSTERALELADQERGRTSQATRVDEVLPPHVVITTPDEPRLQVHAPQLTVRAVAKPVGKDPITAMRLLCNGRPYQGPDGIKDIRRERSDVVSVRESWEVDLVPGVHRFTVKAETARSYGLSDPVEVTYAPDQQQLPALYVVAVGISAYEDERLRLQYGAADARSLAETFQKTAVALYRHVEIKVLTDGQATRSKVLEGLRWLKAQMTQHDVGIFTFSGHGAKDLEEIFYLIPFDCQPGDLAATGVSEDQMKRYFQTIPGRLLVLLDCCHAGALGGDRRKSVGGLADNLVRDLVSDDYGVVLMCSAMGREAAWEDEAVRQGAFTKALVEGLQGAADYDDDGIVYINELDHYASQRVKSLTGGKQHAATQKPATLRNFPLGKP